jgi:L-ascorbate metabolism protein UlaG (beta-lactamase superfamily)
MSIALTWFGHAAMQLDVDGTKLLVDPFFTGNPAASTTAERVAADYILVSHGHGDHVGDAVAIAKRTGATVSSNSEIVNSFTAQGVKNHHAQHLGRTPLPVRLPEAHVRHPRFGIAGRIVRREPGRLPAHGRRTQGLPGL